MREIIFIFGFLLNLGCAESPPKSAPPNVQAPLPSQVEKSVLQTPKSINPELEVSVQRTHLTAPEAVQQIEDYSLESLEAISNYQLLVLQRSTDAKISKNKLTPILKCDPSISEINQWMMQLKSLMDEKTSALQRDYLKTNVSDRTHLKEWLKCQESCLCGLYASVIEDLPPQKITPADSDFAKTLRAMKNSESESQALRCAKKLSWFCKSPLRKYLKGH